MVSNGVDAIVVGAGVVGLAIARRLALAGQEVIVLDANESFGMETSSRNSEVIHAGIYYPTGSLKARLCVEGKARLYAFCDARGVDYRRCGKLIVGTGADQEKVLETLKATAARNGVADLEWRDRAAVAALEPDVACDVALLSPSTGIIDSHAYMQALLGEAEAHGATLVCNTAVAGIDRTPEGWAVRIAGESEPVVVARSIVNAAGLGAQRLALATEGLEAAHVPPLHYAKGCYFSYAGRTRFRHLVYPVPEPGGLGTHLTLDLAGQARLGPDVAWIDAIDYAVSPDRRDKFARAAALFWPGIDAEKLQPAYAGIRPKITAPGEPAADFRIDGPETHGLPGIVNLFGIESPGLTASLAIADHVHDLWSAAQ